MKEEYLCLGLMSGTSLDGVDLCLARFRPGSWEDFEIVEAETRGYPDSWRARLKGAFEASGGDSEELVQLHEDYGTYLGKLVKSFLSDRGVDGVDLIASHGHTVHHRPDLGLTRQVGSGKAICEETGVTVVSNFREQDVKLGGQGAPLVPIGDELLFKGYEVCLNLGGIANLSFSSEGKRLAFDIVPVNLVLNHYAVSKLGLPYDDGGSTAREGDLVPALLDVLNALEFYDKALGPKSLGYEFVVDTIFPLLENSGVSSTADVLRTFTEHAACQIAKTLKGTGKSRVLVTGGGAYNTFLVERIRTLSGFDEVCVPDPEIVEFKEALIFGLLGVLRLEGINNCLSSVTGAQRDHCSGDLHQK